MADPQLNKKHVQPVSLYPHEIGSDTRLPAGETRPFPVRLPNQSSAHGDLQVAQLQPYIQARGTYNFRPANFREFSASGGSVSYADREFAANCTSTLGSYGVLRSLRSVNFRSGLGASIRMRARFSTGVANSQQAVGGFNIGDEYSFGYNGTEFGIFIRYGGLAEVQRLTVTGGAGGSENATVTLDGTEYTVPLTAGATTLNAKEIAEYIEANSTTVNAKQNGSTVTFFWLSDGPKTGTMSFSSSTATATIAEITNGVTKTTTHVAQADWNGDVPDDFDPTLYNAYKIEYNGNADFYIEDPARSNYLKVHSYNYLNSSTEVIVGDPSLRLGLYAYNLGAASGVSCYCSSMAGFVDGTPSEIRNPRAYQNTKSIATTLTNIFTLRNVEVINGVPNQVEISPRMLTLANEGNKTAIFELRTQPTVAGDVNFQYENEDVLVSEVDTAGTTVTGGVQLGSFVLGPGDSLVVNIEPLRIRVPPTLRICIAGQLVSGSAADLSASMTWYEDV